MGYYQSNHCLVNYAHQFLSISLPPSLPHSSPSLPLSLPPSLPPIPPSLPPSLPPSFLISTDVPDVSTNVPLSLLAPVNQPLTLSCDYSAVPVPSITWSRGGTIVDQSNTHVTITSTDTHSDLLLSSITSDEGGEYTCTARNLVGSSSLSFTVTVVQGTYINRLCCYFTHVVIIL